MKIADNFYYSPNGFISIANPKEVHANPYKFNNNLLEFDTLYISPEIVVDVFGHPITFENPSFYNPALNAMFRSAALHLVNDEAVETQACLVQFLKELKASTATELVANEELNSEMEQVLAFVEANYKNTLNLDIISQHFGFDKFNFSKSFRKIKGISPMQYVNMRKVFAAKEQIDRETNLTQLAYDFDFESISYFSKCFKKFVGVSPKVYQKGIV